MKLVPALLTASLLSWCLLEATNPSLKSLARSADDSTAASTLKIDIVDGTNQPVAARFALKVDGKPFEPETLGKHGLRFVSVHESKRQVYPVTYARGTGPVEVSIPAGAETVQLSVAKGFEYLPVSKTLTVNSAGETNLKVEVERWAHLEAEGWLAADAHVHYDRLAASGDQDWLTMLDADGLSHACFMVLKGGKVPGVWAEQYAYGKPGEASDGQRLLISGEEYRDSAMGHINLLGLSDVIQPISTGGLGEPKVHVNWPPLLDVMNRSSELGGLSGVAHGGSLGRHPTATADTILDGVDFFEIGNAHLYAADLWYRLLNCGYELPPAAGTDLPNYPFRDAWQPFLGSMRMYVKTDGRRDFDSWKKAVKRGAVFITSGPLLEFAVNGEDAGGVVKLPAGGGEVVLGATLRSPLPLRELEVVQSGKVLETKFSESKQGSVHQLRIQQRVRVDRSCWLAVRGRGVTIDTLKNSIQGDAPWIETDAIAHSGIVRVIVDNQPVRSRADAQELVRLLRTQQEYYRTQGRYVKAGDRLKMLELFERAVQQLQSRN